MKIDCKGRSWPAYEETFEKAIKKATETKPVYITREGILKTGVRGIEKQLCQYWIISPRTYYYAREPWTIYSAPEFD